MPSQGFDGTTRQEIEDGSQYFGDTLLQEDSLDVGSQVAHGSLGYVSPSLRRIPQITHESMLGLDMGRSEKKQSSAVGGDIQEAKGEHGVHASISEGKGEAASSTAVMPAPAWLSTKSTGPKTMEKQVILIEGPSEPRAAEVEI